MCGNTGGGGNIASKNSGDTEQFAKDLQNAIESRIVTTKLNKKNQEPHRYGTVKFEKRVSDGEFPSYFNMSNMEIQKIINAAGTKGEIYKTSEGQFKQVIKLQGKIAMFGDRKAKKYIPTDRATIHYSKDGTHIVPAHPKE